MNLSKIELDELNNLLKNPKLDIPDFRREVSSNGCNYSWLQKHIQQRNSNIEKRCLELLNIKH